MCPECALALDERPGTAKLRQMKDRKQRVVGGARLTLLGQYVIWFYGNSTQARVLLEEGTSTKKIPLS